MENFHSSSLFRTPSSTFQPPSPPSFPAPYLFISLISSSLAPSLTASLAHPSLKVDSNSHICSRPSLVGKNIGGVGGDDAKLSQEQEMSFFAQPDLKKTDYQFFWSKFVKMLSLYIHVLLHFVFCIY